MEYVEWMEYNNLSERLTSVDFETKHVKYHEYFAWNKYLAKAERKHN